MFQSKVGYLFLNINKNAYSAPKIFQMQISISYQLVRKVQHKRFCIACKIYKWQKIEFYAHEKLI